MHLPLYTTLCPSFPLEEYASLCYTIFIAAVFLKIRKIAPMCRSLVHKQWRPNDLVNCCKEDAIAEYKQQRCSAILLLYYHFLDVNS